MAEEQNNSETQTAKPTGEAGPQLQPARPIIKPAALADKPKPPGRTVTPDVRWCVAGLKGLRADVKQQIAALPNVPDGWKALLQSEIDAVRPEVKAVEVHCHCHHHLSGASATGRKKVLHLDISEVF